MLSSALALIAAVVSTGTETIRSSLRCLPSLSFVESALVLHGFPGPSKLLLIRRRESTAPGATGA